MTVVNKIKQLEGKSFAQLVDLAKAEGNKTDQKIAIWIIAHSINWKSQGYEKIMAELKSSKE